MGTYFGVGNNGPYAGVRAGSSGGSGNGLGCLAVLLATVFLAIAFGLYALFTSTVGGVLIHVAFPVLILIAVVGFPVWALSYAAWGAHKTNKEDAAARRVAAAPHAAQDALTPQPSAPPDPTTPQR